MYKKRVNEKLTRQKGGRGTENGKIKGHLIYIKGTKRIKWKKKKLRKREKSKNKQGWIKYLEQLIVYTKLISISITRNNNTKKLKEIKR